MSFQKLLINYIPDMVDSEVKRGDIVQITDPTHPWCGILFIVDEPKCFGFQGFCLYPTSMDGDTKQIFARPRREQYTKVGKVALELAQKP